MYFLYSYGSLQVELYLYFTFAVPLLYLYFTFTLPVLYLYFTFTQTGFKSSLKTVSAIVVSTYSRILKLQKILRFLKRARLSKLHWTIGLCNEVVLCLVWDKFNFKNYVY
jgi:hypothetical protein